MTERKRTIDDLIKIIRNVDDSETSRMGFDMAYEACMAKASPHPCGSAACIGGHAAFDLKMIDLLPEVAVEYFGIDESDSEDICYPPTNHKGWKAKQRHAIRLLEIYRDEGVVDWDRAMEE